jgi:hypothetical protein
VLQIVLPVGVLAAVALALKVPRPARAAALVAVLGALALAPATWAVQTLGHATSGTFPAGGPTAQGFGGGPAAGGPGAGGFGGGGGRFAPPGGTAPGGGVPGGGFAPGGGGGPFGGDSTGLYAAIAYVRAHGGGTVAISSQQGASSTIIETGANVAALGGFSGRESEVSVSWLAEQVRAGKIRWVLTDGQGGALRNDGRTGSTTAMTAVAQTCTSVGTSSGAGSTTSTSGLYDCAGTADALASAAS